MADRPILLFPKSIKVTYKAHGGGSNKNLSRPSKATQNTRIEAMFRKVTEAFDNRRIELQQTADYAPPEMVLVFETRGTIEEFFKAVRRIPELKYLGDFEKEFDPSPEFKYSTEEDKPIIGKLFCVLASSAALRELQTLWKTWRTKREKFRTGEAKWKHLFNLLYDIRIWGVKDRIEETGILIDWKERLDLNQERISFEVELWYRKSKRQREFDSERIRNLTLESNGRVISECVIEEINYHGLLIEAPISIFNNILEDNAVQLFKANEIMYIRPVGQNIGFNEIEFEEFEKPIAEQTIDMPPVIAMLDGVPMQNHFYLAGRIDVLDSDNFQEDYPVEARRHSTGIASLIIHGDLNENNPPLRSRVLVRPVMQAAKSFDEFVEFIPESQLLLDLIHRAVRDIMEHEDLKRTVRVFNISLGDRFRVFDTILSSWAKLLDWLSDKYNILFVVSAGNVTDDITFSELNDPIHNIITNPKLLGKEFFKYAYAKNRHRKLISPAESINALTVGACHADSCGDIQLNNRIDFHSYDSLASPISRMGLGYRKSIKPEILANGGRMLFRQDVQNQHSLTGLFKQSAIPPGIKAASPINGIRSTVYTKGTSNSAALVTHSIGKMYESLVSSEELRRIINEDYFPVIAKSLIVHSASWNQESFNVLKDSIVTNENTKDAVSRFLGYGKVDPNRIMECTEKRVTLIGYGKLQPEKAEVFEFPLPNSLSGKVLWKKVVATLGWLSPVNCDSILYRKNKLWFEFQNKELDEKLKASRLYYNDDTVRRGTIQHEIFYGTRATAFSDEILKIKVNCKTDAIRYDSLTSSEVKELKHVKYGLVVTLEVDPKFEGDIYSEVSLRIKPPVPIQPL